MPRPRKPDELKLLDGTFRRDRDGEPSSVVLADGEPNPAPWLNKEALALWQEIVPHLTTLGIAKTVDSHQLSALCSWWAQWRKFSAALDALPLDDAAVYRLQIMAGISWANFDKIASRFGLTPVDRARLRLSGAKPPKLIVRKRT